VIGRLHRRQLLAAGVAIAAPTLIGSASAAEAPLPALPFRVMVADLVAAGGGASRPAVTPAFVDAQLAQATALFAPHGVAFVESKVPRAAIAATHGRLETRADRDALAAHLLGGTIELFFVGSLRDVDDPSGFRMGVTWRKLTDLSKKYVIVAADAGPTTLAHELGHYLGNGHSSVRNNLMSYDRDGGEVSLDAAQGKIARRTARVLIARRELVPPG
jgi:hypothetical protein